MWANRKVVGRLPVMQRMMMSDYPSLKGVIRTMDGSRKSRQLRHHGMLPGLLYGQEDTGKNIRTLVAVDKKTVNSLVLKYRKSFENTIFELELFNAAGESEKFNVIPRDTTFCGLKDTLLSVNFLRYRPGTKVSIPLEFINQDRSPDLKRGSFIYRVNTFVDCICDEEIPHTLPVDVGDAIRGKVYRLNSVAFPPNVRPAKTVNPDFIACVVKTPKG